MNIPFEYQGRLIYPLIENFDQELMCTKCIAAPHQSMACRQLDRFMPPDNTCGDGRASYIWAEGPEAQAQYILERLTS